MEQLGCAAPAQVVVAAGRVAFRRALHTARYRISSCRTPRTRRADGGPRPPPLTLRYAKVDATTVRPPHTTGPRGLVVSRRVWSRPHARTHHLPRNRGIACSPLPETVAGEAAVLRPPLSFQVSALVLCGYAHTGQPASPCWLSGPGVVKPARPRGYVTSLRTTRSSFAEVSALIATKCMPDSQHIRGTRKRPAWQRIAEREVSTDRPAASVHGARPDPRHTIRRQADLVGARRGSESGGENKTRSHEAPQPQPVWAP
jgi:hypothetical protein